MSDIASLVLLTEPNSLITTEEPSECNTVFLNELPVTISFVHLIDLPFVSSLLTINYCRFHSICMNFTRSSIKFQLNYQYTHCYFHTSSKPLAFKTSNLITGYCIEVLEEFPIRLQETLQTTLLDAVESRLMVEYLKKLVNFSFATNVREDYGTYYKGRQLLLHRMAVLEIRFEGDFDLVVSIEEFIGPNPASPLVRIHTESCISTTTQITH